MSNKTIKKVMAHFLEECQKFVNLRDKKLENGSLTDVEARVFANAKNVIAQYGSMIKGLNLSSKEIAEAVLAGMGELKFVGGENNYVKRKLGVGEATSILSQFVNPEEFIRNDTDVKSKAIEIVRQSDSVVILAKFSAIHKNYDELAVEEEKFKKMIEEFNDAYISPEVVELSIAFASEYFNTNVVDEFELPVDASFVIAQVFGKEYDEDEEMGKNSVSLGQKAVSGAGNDGDEAGE